MRRFSVRNEQGIALVLTVFALVVIGAVVAGTFFVGRVEQTTGYSTVWSRQAGEAAETGLTWTMTNVEAPTYLAIPVWSPATPSELDLGSRTVAGMPHVSYSSRIRRLNQTLFQVTAVGTRRGTGGRIIASETLVQLVRLAKPTIGVNAAITVQDPIKFNGNTFSISGMNALPPQWLPAECAALDPGNSDDVVGIRSSTGTGANSSDMNNIQGFPTKVVANDPSVTSETFRDFLDYTYATLAAQPGVKVLPSTSTYNGVGPVLDLTQSPAVCNKAAALNFGEPFRNPPTAGAVTQCQNYYPTVHGTGASLKFAAGSRGQGILLVDGDLELAGGFEWSGLVIVRGQMKINGTGNKLYGAILTEGVDLNTSGSVSGNVEIGFSACAIEKAVLGAAVPVPLSRGWAQVF